MHPLKGTEQYMTKISIYKVYPPEKENDHPKIPLWSLGTSHLSATNLYSEIFQNLHSAAIYSGHGRTAWEEHCVYQCVCAVFADLFRIVKEGAV